MTNAEQLTGRSLDAAVAERVMGWRNVHGGYALGDIGGDRPDSNKGIERVPNYSESIEAAMQVVEEMRERGWTMEIYAWPDRYGVSAYHSGDSEDFHEQVLSNINTRTETYLCGSLAKAICLAALEASGVDAAELFDLNEGNAALSAIEEKKG